MLRVKKNHNNTVDGTFHDAIKLFDLGRHTCRKQYAAKNQFGIPAAKL